MAATLCVCHDIRGQDIRWKPVIGVEVATKRVYQDIRGQHSQQ